jgi:hypothetical protein
MYQVDNKTDVAYTRPQLQVVKESEVAPQGPQRQIEKIVRKFKKNNKIVFEIKFKDTDETKVIPRTELMKTHPALVRGFK